MTSLSLQSVRALVYAAVPQLHYSISFVKTETRATKILASFCTFDYHLTYGKSLIILSKLFQLILLTQYVPKGFKLSYIFLYTQNKRQAIQGPQMRWYCHQPYLCQKSLNIILEQYQSYLYTQITINTVSRKVLAA